VVQDFAVDSRLVGGTRVLGVVGELDVATAPQVAVAGEAALTTRAPLVLDLSRCTFLDSTGCRSVGLVGRAAFAAGLAVALVSPPEVRAVRRVVDHVGLASLMPVHDSLEGALAPVGEGGGA
jgi:anti-sigma B factor antagonist